MVRLRHRYLLLQILYPTDPVTRPAYSSTITSTLLHIFRPSPPDLNVRLFHSAIRDEVAYMYGDYGVGLISSSLKIIYFSPVTSTIIIRVARAHYRIVWAALSWMTRVPREKRGEGLACVMRVVRVCGTIKKAEEEVIRRAKADILRAKSENGERVGNILEGLLGRQEIGVEKSHDMERKKRGTDLDDEMDTEEDGDDEDEEDAHDG